ncbi:hypothetical protein NE237_023211 [Protea cynaroides]|uniref:Aminotransferase class I/classII large domain-containing protein n=1 Tax=Protea cynaroides TaxID=273540 RepID=A0A9Q0K574_9MAGN|nr:hypothetical protein NE237_023211 [Protea cynaroides]
MNLDGAGPSPTDCGGKPSSMTADGVLNRLDGCPDGSMLFLCFIWAIKLSDSRENSEQVAEQYDEIPTGLEDHIARKGLVIRALLLIKRASNVVSFSLLSTVVSSFLLSVIVLNTMISCGINVIVGWLFGTHFQDAYGNLRSLDAYHHPFLQGYVKVGDAGMWIVAPTKEDYSGNCGTDRVDPIQRRYESDDRRGLCSLSKRGGENVQLAVEDNYAAYGFEVANSWCCYVARKSGGLIPCWSRSKGLLPFSKSTYQSFASGSLDADTQSVRFFVADGGECLVAQIYAKNMGLYGERVGALNIFCRIANIAFLRRLDLQQNLEDKVLIYGDGNVMNLEATNAVSPRQGIG